MYMNTIGKALLFAALFSQLSIFTADRVVYAVQMAGEETGHELHTFYYNKLLILIGVVRKCSVNT